jgi:hypothetical protein
MARTRGPAVGARAIAHEPRLRVRLFPEEHERSSGQVFQERVCFRRERVGRRCRLRRLLRRLLLCLLRRRAEDNDDDGEHHAYELSQRISHRTPFKRRLS